MIRTAMMRHNKSINWRMLSNISNFENPLYNAEFIQRDGKTSEILKLKKQLSECRSLLWKHVTGKANSLSEDERTMLNHHMNGHKHEIDNAKQVLAMLQKKLSEME